jgi:methylated-DNA-[protein]-cysteine S-methyltransferase
MQETITYAVFRTKWGYFGLAGTEKGLLRTCLPLSELGKVKRRLLIGLPGAKCEETLFNTLQRQIIAYFEGTYVDFGRNIPIALDPFSQFASRVLTACRKVRLGQTISYGELAKKVGNPAAARAIGRVMASNPLPLIIPCHRVICSDGRIGGFSAQGGTKLKNRLLQFERKTLQNRKR